VSDQDLRSYMTRFPGSFIGFLDNVANILKGLGDDWLDAGEQAYAETFHSASEQILNVSSSLVKISDDYNNRQALPTDKKTIAEAYRAKVLKWITK
jgi:hypothetical protein